ncbi:MAG: hypothetical protein ABSF12_15570 [Bryobacteraceae bacterium]
MRRTAFVLTFIVAAMGQQKDVGLLRVPGWFSLFEPENERINEKTTEKIRLSYDVNSSFDAVVGFYETSLREAGVRFGEDGDRQGATLMISAGERTCKLAIANQAMPHVEFECQGAPAPVHSADVQRGAHQIEYVIDGSAPAAGLTYRNAGGGTEQRDVDLPARLTFQTGSGASIFIAAQKKGEEGTVRVKIVVDGRAVGQSTASAPYGIASASGRLDR